VRGAVAAKASADAKALRICRALATFMRARRAVGVGLAKPSVSASAPAAITAAAMAPAVCAAPQFGPGNVGAIVRVSCPMVISIPVGEAPRSLSDCCFCGFTVALDFRLGGAASPSATFKS
jgi:hypothetical protein